MTLQSRTFHSAIGAFVAVTLVTYLSLLGSEAQTSVQSANGPRFELIDQRERPVRERDLAAKPTVLHFGFTHCPVICPTILFELSEYMRELGDKSDQFNFVFVTVDPERDTPEVLRQYLGSFDNRILGLTGSSREVKALADGVGATYSMHTVGDGSYTYDHTVSGYLLSAGWVKHGNIYMGTDSRRTAVLQSLIRLSRIATP